MKRTLLILFLFFFCINSYAQINFESGYYITNANEKVTGLIKNEDWKNNPISFEFKNSESDTPQIINIEQAKEFGVENSFKFVKVTLDIDRSSNNEANLSKTRAPQFVKETIYLKVLIDGKAKLYSYQDSNIIRYFYSTENIETEQLVYKKYNISKYSTKKVAENDLYKFQLSSAFKSKDLDKSTNKLQYREKDLIDYFEKYNAYNGTADTNVDKKEKKDLINLTVKAGLDNSSLSIQNSRIDDRSVDFDNKIGLRFGAELEYILPFNQNKWSIFMEPMYQSYEVEKTIESNAISGGELDVSAEYNSVEIPLGIRYYFFLSENSKLFLSAAHIIDISSKSIVEYTRPNGKSFVKLDSDTRSNFSVGLGYKYNDKISVEFRIQNSRDTLTEYSFIKSDYNTVSVIFGYTIF